MSRGRKMNRITVIRIVNLAIGVLALNQVLTGIFQDFMPRHIFVAVHTAGGLSFAAASVLHIVLNWAWIKANYFRKEPPAGGPAKPI